METKITRLCELTLQDHEAYQALENSASISIMKTKMEAEAITLETQIIELDKDYKTLLADKNCDNVKRMEIANTKLNKSHRLEYVYNVIANENLCLIELRKELSATQESKASLNEQRQITDELWKA